MLARTSRDKRCCISTGCEAAIPGWRFWKWERRSRSNGACKHAPYFTLLNRNAHQEEAISLALNSAYLKTVHEYYNTYGGNNQNWWRKIFDMYSKIGQLGIMTEDALATHLGNSNVSDWQPWGIGPQGDDWFNYGVFANGHILTLSQGVQPAYAHYARQFGSGTARGGANLHVADLFGRGSAGHFQTMSRMNPKYDGRGWE